jgi:hypothetical protein
VIYQFHTGDEELDRLIRRVRAARAAVQRYEEHTRRLTDQVLMLPGGPSQRDLGVLLGLSYQRVHQLVERRRLLARMQEVEETERYPPIKERGSHETQRRDVLRQHRPDRLA